jgi:unsaturated rhamnogalacturonyl hydrolase
MGSGGRLRYLRIRPRAAEILHPMTSIADLKNITRIAADLLLTYPWKLWFWGDSIGLEGLLDATELTGDQKYLGFVQGLFKGWIARERHRSEFDYTAPGVALLRTYEESGDAALLHAAERHAEYLAAFRKTTGGAYVRYENAAIELPPELPADHPDFLLTIRSSSQVQSGGACVFVDSVHFDGPFFAKLYRVTGEDKYRRLALDNILPQINLLYDPNDRLFHHFWIERTGCRNGIAWGRGNGWGLLGIVETLEHLPSEGLGETRLTDVLRTTAERLAGLQDSCGGWHTVLNDGDSYIETSIAAFAVHGFARAIQRSWLKPEKYCPVIESAMDFLLRHVRSDGLLEGVSYETFPSSQIEHYRRMPRGGIVPWGQGPLLTALRSYVRLQDFMRVSRIDIRKDHPSCAPITERQ